MMCKVLIFGCISALMLVTAANAAPTPSGKEKILKTLIMDLNYLEKSKHKIHHELFTPIDKEECTQQTLDCYLSEINILKHEIKHGDAVHLQNIQKNLQALMNQTSTGAPGCKICEEHDKKKYPEFHRELKNFLTYMLK